MTIPPQWVPAIAETEKGAEKTFEDVEYGTEKEKLEGAAAKKFGEFRERLDITWEVTGDQLDGQTDARMQIPRART